MFNQRFLLQMSFIISLVATFGSLFFSEVLKYPPCALCWYQRIFMYPQVIILGLAIFKKDLSVVTYSISLSLVGFIIALYHNFVQFGFSALPCPAVGNSVSCAKLFFIEFGYITIPLMSLVAFSMMIIFVIFSKLQEKNFFQL